MTAPAAVDVLIFEVGDVRFGADASQVLRIDSPFEPESVGYPLGPVKKGKRALVFAAPDGSQRRLTIDLVRGVRTIPLENLRRLPAVARREKFSIGAWLDGDRAVVLVDLLHMVS